MSEWRCEVRMSDNSEYEDYTQDFLYDWFGVYSWNYVKSIIWWTALRPTFQSLI